MVVPRSFERNEKVERQRSSVQEPVVYRPLRSGGRYDHLFKVMLIGDSAVGKTCLMFRFTDNLYSDTFISTIGIDFKMKTVCIGDRAVRLQIWDTAGQEKFFNITRSYYRNADSIVLIFDVSRAESFNNVRRWMNNIEENASGSVHRILVGNKCDLENERVVTKSAGESLAHQYNIEYMETSAKSNINVNNLFLSVTNSLMLKTDIVARLRKEDKGEESRTATLLKRIIDPLDRVRPSKMPKKTAFNQLSQLCIECTEEDYPVWALAKTPSKLKIDYTLHPFICALYQTGQNNTSKPSSETPAIVQTHATSGFPIPPSHSAP
ncbi:hypothetical protein ACOME3_007454 [Neoechinorhynchus agilis]